MDIVHYSHHILFVPDIPRHNSVEPDFQTESWNRSTNGDFAHISEFPAEYWAPGPVLQTWTGGMCKELYIVSAGISVSAATSHVFYRRLAENQGKMVTLLYSRQFKCNLYFKTKQ